MSQYERTATDILYTAACYSAAAQGARDIAALYQKDGNVEMAAEFLENAEESERISAELTARAWNMPIEGSKSCH